MTTPVIIEQKKIYLNKLNSQILDIFKEAVKSIDIKIPELEPQEPRLRQGAIAKCRKLIESVISSRFGAQEAQMNGDESEGIVLDGPALQIRDAFVSAYNAEMKKNGVTDKEIENMENGKYLIEDHHVLVRHISISLVTLALCTDMTNSKDGDKLIGVLERFNQGLIENRTFEKKSTVFATKLLPLGAFISFKMTEWYDTFRQAVKAIKLVHLNTSTIKQTASALNEIDLTIRRLILAILKPNQKEASYAYTLVKGTLESTEKDILARVTKPHQSNEAESANSMVVSNAVKNISSSSITSNKTDKPEHENKLFTKLAKNPELQRELSPLFDKVMSKKYGVKSEKLIIRKTMILYLYEKNKNFDEVRRLVDLYVMLDENEVFTLAVSELGLMNTLSGWVLILMGIMSYDEFDKKLQEHSSKFKNIIKSVELKGRAAVAYARYSSSKVIPLLEKIDFCIKNIQDIMNPEMLNKLSKILHECLSKLSKFQKLIGCKFINENRLNELSQRFDLGGVVSGVRNTITNVPTDSGLESKYSIEHNNFFKDKDEFKGERNSMQFDEDKYSGEGDNNGLELLPVSTAQDSLFPIRPEPLPTQIHDLNHLVSESVILFSFFKDSSILNLISTYYCQFRKEIPDTAKNISAYLSKEEKLLSDIYSEQTPDVISNIITGFHLNSYLSLDTELQSLKNKYKMKGARDKVNFLILTYCLRTELAYRQLLILSLALSKGDNIFPIELAMIHFKKISSKFAGSAPKEDISVKHLIMYRDKFRKMYKTTIFHWGKELMSCVNQTTLDALINTKKGLIHVKDINCDFVNGSRVGNSVICSSISNNGQILSNLSPSQNGSVSSSLKDCKEIKFEKEIKSDPVPSVITSVVSNSIFSMKNSVNKQTLEDQNTEFKPHFHNEKKQASPIEEKVQFTHDAKKVQPSPEQQIAPPLPHKQDNEEAVPETDLLSDAYRSASSLIYYEGPLAPQLFNRSYRSLYGEWSITPFLLNCTDKLTGDQGGKWIPIEIYRLIESEDRQNLAMCENKISKPGC